MEQSICWFRFLETKSHFMVLLLDMNTREMFIDEFIEPKKKIKTNQ